ncbi:MBL fold metallo-hydrolase [Cupriavidus sp. 8B]
MGAFGVRRHLLHQLEAHAVKPDEITDVVLTHAHYDHAVNYTSRTRRSGSVPANCAGPPRSCPASIRCPSFTCVRWTLANKCVG